LIRSGTRLRLERCFGWHLRPRLLRAPRAAPAPCPARCPRATAPVTQRQGAVREQHTGPYQRSASTCSKLASCAPPASGQSSWPSALRIDPARPPARPGCSLSRGSPNTRTLPPEISSCSASLQPARGARGDQKGGRAGVSWRTWGAVRALTSHTNPCPASCRPSARSLLVCVRSFAW
jgi:hypothetical protein